MTSTAVVASLGRRLLGRGVPKQPRRALRAAAEGEACSGAGAPLSTSTTTATSREARRKKWLKEKAAPGEGSAAGAASAKVRCVRAKGGEVVKDTLEGRTLEGAKMENIIRTQHDCN